MAKGTTLQTTFEILSLKAINHAYRLLVLFMCLAGLSNAVNRAWVWLPVLSVLVCHQTSGVCHGDW